MNYGDLLEAFNDPVLITNSAGEILFLNTPARLNLSVLPRMNIAQKIEDRAFLGLFKQSFFEKHSRYLEIQGQKFIVSLTSLEADLHLLHFKDNDKENTLNKVRADFVANASHELRTPLAILSGALETLMTSAKEDAPAQERFLNLMQQQTKRMSHLINDLLSLSKVEMQEPFPPIEKVSLRDVLELCIVSLGQLIKNNDMQIEISHKGENCLIFGDKEELLRLFENLIENAFKYAREGKRITIVIEKAEYNAQESVRVLVKDYGKGVEPKHLSRLSERFYRADVSKSESTGLGLALVKHIMSHHRGRVEYKSKSGEGLEVHLTFPLA
jgi:two-component system, OmpR family, phosphate regulon sensor histidine kinase PhoR